ncbi:MAG: tetratricopeptide repeat protein, partial [Planctomycetota bacterium]
HHRLGQALLLKGRDDQARVSLQLAIDEDICPLRANSTIVQTVRDVAGSADLPLVDFENRLRELSQKEHQTSCLGEKYFVDHVHPNIVTHGRLAQWIIETLLQHDLVSGTPLTETQFASVAERVESSVTIERQAIAYRNLAKLWNWCGRFESCEIAARQCLEFLPWDSEARYLLARSLVQLDDPDAAEFQFDVLFQMDPNCLEAFIPAGLLYVSQENWSAAKRTLTPGVFFEPERADALVALAKAHTELNEPELARAALDKARDVLADESEFREYTSWYGVDAN